MVGQKLIWSIARDLALLRLRREGLSWDAIGAVLQISRNASIERGRRLGARLPARERIGTIETEDRDRAPLPSGHVISWGVLVAGTVLADEPYPLPAPWGREWADGARWLN